MSDHTARKAQGWPARPGWGITITSVRLQSMNTAATLYAHLRDVATNQLADIAAATAAFLGPRTEQISQEELLRRADAGVTEP